MAENCENQSQDLNGTHCDWVEELFPPKYTYEDYKELIEPIGESKTSLEKLLGNGYRLDAETIKNIYLRVLARVTAEKRVSDNITRLVDVSTQTSITAANSHSPPRKLPEESSTVGTADRAGSSSSKSFWSSFELQLLRDHYKSEHQEFISARAELCMARKEMEKSDGRLKEVSDELVQSDAEVLNRRAHIHRLETVNDSLRGEIVRITNQLCSTDNDLQLLESELQGKRVAEKQHSIRMSELHMKCKLLENKLEKAGSEFELETDRKIRAMQLKHDTEVVHLTDRLNNLEENLDKEKELHERCRKGMNQLLLHYSQSPSLLSTVDK